MNAIDVILSKSKTEEDLGPQELQLEWTDIQRQLDKTAEENLENSPEKEKSISQLLTEYKRTQIFLC